MVASLRSALQSTLQQNAELRTRLAKIRAETELGAVASSAAMDAAAAAAGAVHLATSMTLELDLVAATHRLGHHSLSYSSSCVSQSEFFDAKVSATSTLSK